ncbi:MAG: hypothetical protein ACE5IR_22885, partial [bacterium]
MSNGGGKFKVFGPFWDSTNSKIFQSIYIYAFAAGTTTPKNFWTDEAKTTAVTSRQGGLEGTVDGFFDGDYKIEIRESDNTTVIKTYDNFKITADTATMWEGNAGTAAPSATTANRWQLFALHDASNNFSDLLINLGASFVSLLRDEVNASWFSTFNAAITAIGSSTKTLVVS